MTNLLIANTFKKFRVRLCASLCFFIFFFAFSLSGYSSASINFDRLLNLAFQQYGLRGQQNITDLRMLFSQLEDVTEKEKLKHINTFVNQKIRIFGDDIDIWNKSDYWATPLESLGREAGDCEDFSIAKYMFLRELGIPNDKLRLTYVRAQIGGPNSRIFQAHMVLSYYETPNAEPLILDNLINDIRTASRRTDLRPIFGFNSDGLWVGSAQESRGTSQSHLSRWRDLLERARNEGIE
jgi:predicted transglutaminase-like cysteine proteinase